jgi:hypothetical protein
LSAGSAFSAGSFLSIGSSGSVLSIGSSGSILAIGSSGSILGIGRAGQAGSAKAMGTMLAVVGLLGALLDR